MNQPDKKGRKILALEGRARKQTPLPPFFGWNSQNKKKNYLRLKEIFQKLTLLDVYAIV